MSSNDLKRIPAADLRENPVALRELNRDNDQYRGLIESIRIKGFTSVLEVTPVAAYKDDKTGQEVAAHFRIVDGLHRFNAGKDAGLTEFPCMIVSIKDENDLLARQLMANFHRVDTRPIEYTRQIQRMIHNNPLMTINEIATQLGVSPQLITGRLRLLQLTEGIQKIVDEGKINLSNAQALAKLPIEEQDQFLERAMVQSPAEFAAGVTKRTADLKAANKQGRDVGEETFEPISRLKKLREIEDERSTLRELEPVLKSVSSPQEGAKLALEWVLSTDASGVALQKAAFDERAAKRRADTEKRTADRLKKKEEAARIEREKYELEHAVKV